MKYFTINELCVSDTYPKLAEHPKPGSTEEKNLTNLIDNLLDPIREHIGKPIIVTSGYRPARLNKAVGGSSTSNHITGCAADCVCVNRRSDNLAIVRAIFDLGLDFDEIIIEGATVNGNEITACRWVHVALRRDGNRKKFLYTADMRNYHPVHIQKETRFTI